MKGQLIWEVIYPLIMVFYLRYVLRNMCDDAGMECTDEEIEMQKVASGISNPLVMCLIVPSIQSIG